MSEIGIEIKQRLFELQDLGYRDFHSKLIPNIDKETVIGVRTPQLRRLAKEFSKRSDIEIFLRELPHEYYEENNLHGFIIENIKDYNTAIEETELFLPFIDNWATCDMITPKIFKKHLEELYKRIEVWINSGQTYTIRFGIGMIMNFYLDEVFSPESMELVAGVRSEEYYVNMMVAWYFATALAKQYDKAINVLIERRLDTWTHNKAIQKAVESRRISGETKDYLRTLKVKN